MADKKIRLLVNLPDGFFRTPQMQKHFDRLETFAEVRKTSHDTPEQIGNDLIWAEAVLMWAWPDLSPEMLGKAKDLRFAGHINVGEKTAKAEIDHGMVVSEARHGWSPAVAEMALTLMLAGLRRTSEFHLQMREGREPWVEDFSADIDPLERRLAGRRVGLLGFGGIGQHLAGLLKPFDVDLIACDPFIPESIAREHGARLVSVDELVSQSEVLVLCASNTPESKNIINAERVRAMPPWTVLVNIGRTWLIDMKALVQRIQERSDLIAMLDVFENEPLEEDALVRKLPNVYCTPHRAGGILESLDMIFEMLIGDLEAFLRGGELNHQARFEDGRLVIGSG